MPRLVIQSADSVPAGALPAEPGVALRGNISTTGVISEADQPLLLWLHELQPGAQIEFDQPPVGHVLYVLAGAVDVVGSDVDGRTVPADDAVVVEHRGKATLRAGPSSAKLAHFHQRPDASTAPAKAGGHVHAGNHPGVYASTYLNGRSDRMSFADSACPTCDLWLHRTTLPGNQEGHTHYHTESEIIIVLRGEMIVGRQTLKPITALAIDANTHYKFSTGPEGMRFLNFRCTEPNLVQKQPDGSYLSYNEREYARSSGKITGTRIPPHGSDVKSTSV